MIAATPRHLPTGSRRAIVFAGALLVLLALAAYHNTFSVPFLFDDHQSIEANPSIQHLSALGDVLRPPKIGSGVTGRPIVNLSLAINYAIGGANPRGYHVFNFLAHALAGLALFGIVRRTLLLPVLRERYGAIALPFAWSVAALWTLHPLQTESVTCVIQRTEVLVGLFYLLTLYCFLRGVERLDPRPLGWSETVALGPAAGGQAAAPRKAPSSRLWFALALTACLLGMASKEVMVSAPLIVLLFDRTFVAGSFRAAWQQRRGLYLGLAGSWILLGYLVFSMGGTRGAVAGLGLGISPLRYAVKQCEAVVHYLRLSLWPHPLVLDYGESLSVHPIGVWIDGVLLAALAAGTAFAILRRSAFGFLGAWFFAILAPSSSIVPLLTQTVAEHRMYLPLAAVLVLVVAALHAMSRTRFPTVVLGMTLISVVMTERRNHDYRDRLAIWRDTAEKSPRNSRAHYNVGVEFANQGHSAEAIACFETALSCKPTDAEAQFGLGHELARRAETRALAIPHFEAALQILPKHIKARIELANALASDPARIPEAIQHYAIALQLEPNNPIAHTDLGVALAKLPGHFDDAVRQFETALRISPTDPDVHFYFAKTLARVPERANESIAHYQRALELRPAFFDARYGLATLLATLPGHDLEAIPHYEAALQLRPNHVQSHYNLGVILANNRRTREAIPHFEAVTKLDPNYAEARDILAGLRQLAPPK